MRHQRSRDMNSSAGGALAPSRASHSHRRIFWQGPAVCLMLSALNVSGTSGQTTPAKTELFPAGKWVTLFDGKSLNNWQPTEFSGAGEVKLEPKFQGKGAAVVVNAGVALSGFNWTGAEIPKTDYEITLEAIKLEGTDFSCGLTFPVGDSHASLILGGWGGATVGISSIDEKDASRNDTTKYITFPRNKWYKVRLRVTPAKLEAWMNDKQIVSKDITSKKISLRGGEISLSTPLGISTYQTSAAFRNIKLRRLKSGSGG